MSHKLLPFPQLLFQRLRKALNRLAVNAWYEPVPLVVERTVSRSGEFPLADAKKCPLKKVSIPCTWEAEGFSTTWFKVSLPKGFKARPDDYFHWDDNAEATAYCDGQPVFGLDCTHRQWPWPKGAKELWLESIFCQTGIWHASAKGISVAGSLLANARLVRKNQASWDAYFDLEVLTDWLEEEVRRALPHDVAERLVVGSRSWPEMDTASVAISPDGVGTGVQNRGRPDLVKLPPLVRKVFRELSEAIIIYHAEGPAALRARLARVYRMVREHADVAPKAVLTGNSHLDLVWLWPESVGEKKAVRSFASVLNLLENQPDFRFSYTQPASYEAVERRQPELFKRVKRQIKRGGWEAMGGMYVESDLLIGCGEALLRSLTIGQKEFLKLRDGKPNKVLWLPDDFGYPGCMPCLMRMAGIKYFYTTKMAWSMINAFPHNSFVWRGTDGSEVLAHLALRTGYNNPARLRNLRLEAECDKQIDIHNEMLIATGWGDGAGGPSIDIIERVRRQKSLRNQPSAEWGNIEAFYRRMEKVRDQLPIHQGDMYLEAHRGTYSTHGYLKHAFREAEKGLRTWEAANALCGAGAIPEEVWKRMVFTQFHDCIPGSSTQDVYDQIVPELRALAEQGATQAKKDLEGPTGESVLFNPLPLPLPYWNKDGRLVKLPPVSTSNPSALPAQEYVALAATNRRLSNGRVQVSFDAKGNFCELTVDGRNAFVAPACPVVYNDIPYDLEAWEIDRDALEVGTPLTLKGLGKPEKGPGWVGLRQKWETSGGSVVEILWRLRAGAVVAEGEVCIDWKEPEKLLRFEVPTPYRGQHALFASPYGAEWRPQASGDSRASAMWEAPASRWLMAANDGRTEGAFIVAEGKYGFSCHDGVMSVTLLKSAKITQINGFPARFRKGREIPFWSDLGKQTIQMALGCLSPDSVREEFPAALAETLFAEPLELKGVERALPIEIEGLESVVPVWVAPLGKDHFVVRLHETLGRSGTIRVVAPHEWTVRRMGKAFPTGRDEKLLANHMLEVSPGAIISLEYIRQ